MSAVTRTKSLGSISEDSSDEEIQAPVKTPVKIDAFKFLMDRRHKSIGSNSPGRERQDAESNPIEQCEHKQKLKKRKLMFEEWSEKRGRSKKKQFEEARGKVIEKKLKTRAKRLKEMLSIDTPGKSLANQKTSAKHAAAAHCDSSDSSDEIFPRSKPVSGKDNLNQNKKTADNYFSESPKKLKKLTDTQAHVSKKRKRKFNLCLNKSKSHENLHVITDTSNTFNENAHHCESKAKPNTPVRTPWKMKVKLLEKENVENLLDEKYDGVVVSSDDEECIGIVAAKAAQQKSTKLAPIFLQSQKKHLCNEKKNSPRVASLPSSELEESVYCSFPVVSHVEQRTLSPLWNLPRAHLPLAEEQKYCGYDSGSLKMPDCLICKTGQPQNKRQIENCATLEQDDVDRLLEEYQKKYSEKSVRKLYETLKELPEEQRTSEECQDAGSFEENDRVWTEKYNPVSRDDIIGNQASVTRLATWLEGWLTPAAKRTRYNSGSSSSGDDFRSGRDQEDAPRPAVSAVNSLLLLVGPHGVGKTSTVYTICEGLGVIVIEINASSKRTGKKLLQELQEATRSHRVRPGDGEAPLSLLLVDDADVVFDGQDEGFVSALKTLARTSLRPIVLTATDCNCEHLRYFMDNYPVLTFEAPPGAELALRLRLLCLVERAAVPEAVVDAITARSRGDVRRALLELQFWSATSCHFQQLSLRNTCSHFTGLWWSLVQRRLISKDICKHLAFADEIYMRYNIETDPEPGVLPWAQTGLTQSLSLEEDSQQYNDGKEVVREMVQWLLEAGLAELGADLEAATAASPTYDDIRWRDTLHAGHRQLNKAVPVNMQLDRGGLAVDYQPMLRQVCRYECNRHKHNRKRGNRFYHYLRNVGAQPERDALRALCRSFSPPR